MYQETYKKLINTLDENKACYRLIDHPAEGRTDIVSPMRGNAIKDAAKCIVVMVKITRKIKKYVLAVVPGDAKVDLNKIKALYNGIYVSFANPEIAEELAGSVSGTILPFSFNPDLELIIDTKILEIEEIYFNAAKLDQSIALNTKDYARIATYREENIALYD